MREYTVCASCGVCLEVFVYVCVYMFVYFMCLLRAPCLITDSVVRGKFLELEAWFVTSFPTEVLSTS